MATDLSSWNYKEKHVRSLTGQGHYASADASLVCSGPAEYSTSNSIYPIGYLENFTLQQSKQLQRLFEIGSQRSYFIPGRVIGSISIGRVYYHGFSLLRVLYPAKIVNTETVKIGTASATATQGGDGVMESENDSAALVSTAKAPETAAAVRIEPGANKFWLNLASDLFNQPLGMAVFFQDSSEDYIGGSYIENAYVQGHQLSLNAGSILLMEGASIQYDRLIPIAFKDSPKDANGNAVTGA